MININQTSEQTKILIPRSNINGDIEKNNYVTEDELQEILKEYNTIPYIVIDGFSRDGFEITKGDWGAVNNAIQNNEPSLIYARSSNTGTVFTLAENIIPYSPGGASMTTTLISAQKNVIFRIWEIDINGNVELYLEDKYTIQTKLVSGENIKTINGNDILGEGDITIEGGNGNIVELTQEEYNSIIPDSDTLYLISDSNIYTSLKTINGESIIGEGNINIGGGDFSNYYTKSEIDNMVGDIETILDNIIGNN